MRCSLITLGCVITVLLLGGCGPAVSKSELGNVVFELPKVAGADRPYQMPQLKEPAPESEHSPR
ncbi:MAG: hypothetical protein LLG00_12760 [Planctomycetaceae bacterium]|nr:hypothetical protein [Planctomycetaceae bacterium]